MRRSLTTLGHYLFLLLAITASAILVVDSQNLGDPAFCGVTSGCMAVRMAPVSRALSSAIPVPLPVLGLAIYGSLLSLAVFGRSLAARLTVKSLCLAGGFVGAMLLALQATSIGAFCTHCVLVDLSAIGAAACSLGLPNRSTAPSLKLQAGWTSLGAAAASLPFLWGAWPVSPSTPPGIQALATPGKATLVVFTDFECPYCRLLHPALEEVLKTYPGRLSVVRKMKPLPSHTGARPAALAYLCVPEAERERMAEALYTAPPESLSSDGVLELGRRLGLSAESLRECMTSASAADQLASDEALFADVGGGGLPRTMLGGRAVLGYDPERLDSIVRSALGGPHLELPLGALFGVLAVGFVVVARPMSRRLHPVPPPDGNT